MKTLIAIGNMVLLLGAGAQAKSGDSFVDLPKEIVHPESIGLDTESGTLYVGSAGNGAIASVTKDGDIKVLQTAGTDGRTRALGIKVDTSRKRLFVVDGAAVYVYDLRANTLLKKAQASEIDVKPRITQETFLNDLLIDEDGSAFITDSFNPHLYRVDGKSLKLSLHAKIEGVPFGKQNEIPFNLNGIAFSQDRKSVISVKTNDGGLYKIDLATGNATRLKTSGDLFRGDGLVQGPNGLLYVVRNFVNTISTVDLLNPINGVYQVRDLPPSRVNIPTGGVYLGGSHPELVVANSQFGSAKPNLPFQLTRIGLEK